MLALRLISVLLNAVLLLAFVQAPSSHIHAHESTARHVAALLHTHVPHVERPRSHRTEWRGLDPDEDARFLSWFVASRAQYGFAPVILTACKIPAPLFEVSEWQTTKLRPSAHDPPTLDATTPRAPPV
jgi:hypothetical protein